MLIVRRVYKKKKRLKLFISVANCLQSSEREQSFIVGREGSR